MRNLVAFNLRQPRRYQDRSKYRADGSITTGLRLKVLRKPRKIEVDNEFKRAYRKLNG